MTKYLCEYVSVNSQLGTELPARSRCLITADNANDAFDIMFTQKTAHGVITYIPYEAIIVRAEDEQLLETLIDEKLQ